MTIFELAKEYLDCFVLDNDRWFLDEHCTPASLKSLVYKVHVGMRPDDYKYRYIVESLTLIVDFGLGGDLSEMLCELEPDLYLYDLLQWLEENTDRVSYVDEVMGNGLTESGLTRLLMDAQLREKEEVLSIIYEQLEEDSIKLTEIEQRTPQAEV